LATSTGTADTATINFAPTLLAANATATMAGFKSTGIETINVSSTQTQSTASGTNIGKGVIELVTDTSNTTASIVITGEGSFTLGKYNTASTTYSDGSTGFLSGVAQFTTAPTTAITDVTTAAALKTIDASAATGVQIIVAGTKQADVHGSSGTTDLVYTGLTIKGGSAADTLVNDADSGVVNGGAGADTIIVTGKASVVDGGTGADTIYVFGGVNATLTGGTGNNTYQLTGASVGDLASIKMITITDYKTSDTLVIGDSDPFTKADISGATSFTNMLELAAASGDAGNASYFVYAGDTYIVRDVGGSDTLTTGDLIVKLVGITSLTGLTGDDTTGLVGVA
jgi:S-layer protein